MDVVFSPNMILQIGEIRKRINKDQENYEKRLKIYEKRRKLREQGIKVNPIDNYKVQIKYNNLTKLRSEVHITEI